MSGPPRPLLVLAAVALLAGSCSPAPVVTDPPAGTTLPPTPTPTPAETPGPSEIPFAAAAWPRAGTACGTPGYAGEMGRIEAVNARTVRFRLCTPDGAFLGKLAHPALGILEAATLGVLATDPASARSVAGTGPYRIGQWDEAGAVILEATGDGAATIARTPTIVLRWAGSAAQRLVELQAATVDGIDAPGSLEIDQIETQPELALVPRAGLATTYLAFGTGNAFDDVRVRRAIGAGLNRQGLATGAFPAGTSAATHLAPCEIAGGCAGQDWYEFDAPASAADLAAAGFDLTATYPLHVPAAPVPGLPDPQRVAAAVQAQLRDGLGIRVTVDAMDPAAFAGEVDAGTLDGLYLGGLASTVADPAAFLGPLLGDGVTSTPASRSRGVSAALADAAGTASPDARAAAFGKANDAVRDVVPLVPLVHPGSMAAFRADVEHVTPSPLGIDALGAFVPGDRRQLVFMQATDPGGTWCGDQSTADAFRLCALVTEPLYGFAPGTLDVEPRLADRCSPNGDATVWTCVLRKGVTFSDGAGLDAGDVLATFVALWDAGQPMRSSRPGATFPAWRALFGGSLGVPPG
jgi:peptide/nickel transport system substrate-binding protein